MQAVKNPFQYEYYRNNSAINPHKDAVVRAQREISVQMLNTPTAGSLASSGVSVKTTSQNSDSEKIDRWIYASSARPPSLSGRGEKGWG
ncbi:MAG: hypothetical protein MUO76_18965 [Anaerolineaceae bacterium]|nr:hypothetical protein [Anaerolineaceae bacterium]